MRKTFLFVLLMIYFNLYSETQSLFPAPNITFIEKNITENCYQNCLTQSKWYCKQCINATIIPTSIKVETFCCFYYFQIDCTFDCLKNLSSIKNDSKEYEEVKSLRLKSIKNVEQSKCSNHNYASDKCKRESL
jgi:hypothetical protein